MKGTLSRKWLSLFLALILCCAVISPASVFAADALPHDALPADHQITSDVLYADGLYASGWVDCDLDESEMRPLLNRETLYPQKTGWMELDQLIESILANAGENADTYTRLRYAYDYLVKNVTYSWEGYSYTTASVKSYNSVTKYDYLSSMTYEDGLQKSIPDDMANRTYHILKYKKGVCYDYAIAIAVIARYIGIESYVHTGLYYFEPYYGSSYSGHHGWALLVLGGEKYVFDPQRDARNWEFNGKNGYYFGIDYATATNTSNRPAYAPNYYTADKNANAERDASMLPVNAERAHKVTISVEATTGGNISGAGAYITGNTATLTATPNDNYAFLGWYDEEGLLLSEDLNYTFSVTTDLTLYAKFCKTHNVTAISSRSGTALGSGIYLDQSEVNLSAESATAAFLGWYDEAATLISNTAEYTFTAEKNIALFAMFEGDVFYDLSADTYYTDYVLEAASRGLVKGITSIRFAPDIPFTRAMLVQILANLEQADTETAASNPFEDVDSTKWYYEEVNWAYENGIVEGIDDTHFAPEAPVTREQVLTMVVRYLELKGIELESTPLTYTDLDQFSDYARPYAEKAQSIGLILGYEDGSFKPKNTLPRREGVTILMRMVHYLDNLPAEDETTEELPEASDLTPESSTDTSEVTPDSDEPVG